MPAATRTAALSRYLAAKSDDPSTEGRLGSVQSFPGGMIDATPTVDTVPSTFGHKVVASPLRLDVAESNRTAPQKKDETRPRSRSLGRSRTRDVVQEVYDRMGVSRDDLKDGGNGSNAEKFQQRYRAAAAMSTPSNTYARGRPTEALLTDGNRRARSLSRGESVTRRWPPTQGQTEQDVENMAPSLTKPVEIVGDTFLKQGFSATASPITSPSRIAISSRSLQKSVAGKSSKSDKKEETSTWKAKAPDPPNAPYAPQKDEQSEDHSEESAIPSVKERMLAFHQPQSKPTSARNFQTKSYPVLYAKKREQHPPKIDIYSDVKRQDEDQVSPMTVYTDQDNSGVAPEASYIPPSPAAAMAANTAAELVRRQQEQRRGTRAPTVSSAKTTDPFALQPKPALVMEIAGADASGGMHVKTPSLSTSGAGDSPLRDGSAHRRSTWSDRNSVAGISSSNPLMNERPSMGSAGFPTPEQLDRIIEERVQARVSSLEAKISIRMQQMEILMEERMNSRMELLETKIDKLGNMLTVVVTNHGKCEI
jgi:hypothetical protein